MTESVRIRISMQEDGKTAKRELMVDGFKVCELSYLDTMNLALSATSSLRWDRNNGK